MPINLIDNYVYLKEDTHQYFDRDNREYLSTSKFIGSFYKKFDANMIAGQVAKSEGVSKQVILNRWEAQTAEGTRKHNALERYFKTTVILPEDEDLRPMILSVVIQYKDYYRVLNEVCVHDKDELTAGTIDLPLICTSSNKSVVDIGDFKNYGRGINQKETDKNGAFKNEYMTGPLSHLQNSSYNKVAIQTSHYAYMLQKMFGVKIGKLFCHYISPENPLINYQIPLSYMKYEIIEMLKWKQENPIILEQPKSILSPNTEWDL